MVVNVRRSAVVLLTLWVMLVSSPAVVVAEETFALIVSGASGGPDYAERYATWRQGLVSALQGQPGFREDHLEVLAETAGPGVGLASRDGVTRAIGRLAERLSAESVLLVVLIGHGTDDGIDAKFNLVGPDLAATEWEHLLAPLPGRLVLVNTTAASYAFVEQLGGAGRVVISATGASAQRYDTVFPEFFVAALGSSSDVADGDRDGRVSVWEAFTFTSAEVRRWYQRRGRLATERAMLDDTGDGRGRDADGVGDGIDADGLVSARVFVGAGVRLADVVDPAVAPLVAERDRLEDEVAALRARRNRLDEDTYRQELEALLLELARVSREIRRRTGV